MAMKTNLRRADKSSDT